MFKREKGINIYNEIRTLRCDVTTGADLLKLATMMGMGRVMHRTPQMAHSDATNLPAGVLQVQTTFLLSFDVSPPYDLTMYFTSRV